MTLSNAEEHFWKEAVLAQLPRGISPEYAVDYADRVVEALRDRVASKEPLQKGPYR